MLLNLAKNGLQAMPEGGTLTVRSFEDRGGLVLEVEDDGTGMPQAAPDTATHYGLAVMRERAARLGGTLDVTARPGGGTRVALVFALQARRTLAVPAVPAVAGAGVH